MTSLQFEGANVALAKDQPEYETLHVLHQPDEHGSPMTACFQLTPEEIAEIVATGCIWHTQWTFGHAFQPIRMSTSKPF